MPRPTAGHSCHYIRTHSAGLFPIVKILIRADRFTAWFTAIPTAFHISARQRSVWHQRQRPRPRNTDITEHGLVFASSAQLTAFDETTVCTITDESGFAVTLDAEQTWFSVSGRPVDLCSAFVVCECDFM
jgi:hypothetical protein